MPSEIDERIESALLKHEHRMKQMVSDLFEKAFPDGDPEGHRRYHETQIRYMEEKVKLWQDIRSKTLAGVVWLGLLACGTAIWEYIKSAIQRGTH